MYGKHAISFKKSWNINNSAKTWRILDKNNHVESSILIIMEKFYNTLTFCKVDNIM